MTRTMSYKPPSTPMKAPKSKRSSSEPRVDRHGKKLKFDDDTVPSKTPTKTPHLFQCPNRPCDKVYTFKNKLTRHLHFGGCKYSDAEPQPPVLNVEQNSTPNIEVKFGDPDTFCSYCNAKFTTKGTRMRHENEYCRRRGIADHYLQQSMEPGDEYAERQDIVESSDDLPKVIPAGKISPIETFNFTCNLCHKSYSQKQTLSRHMRAKHMTDSPIPSHSGKQSSSRTSTPSPSRRSTTSPSSQGSPFRLPVVEDKEMLSGRNSSIAEMQTDTANKNSYSKAAEIPTESASKKISKKITDSLKLNKPKSLHTCIMCANQQKIEINQNKWNIIQHYTAHYKQQGTWDHIFPKVTKKQKEEYFNLYSNKYKMIEGYNCKKCKNNGVDQTWFFRAWNLLEEKKAKDAAIDHLVKCHGMLYKIMEKDTCVDMTPVINLLGISSQPDVDESNEQWLELWTGCEKFNSVKRKRKPAIERLNRKEIKLAGTYNASQKYLSECPLASQSIGTDSLELNKPKSLHTCIKCPNQQKIEIDQNKWNIIQHYTEHYKQQGTWDHIFPEKPEKQKEEYLNLFSDSKNVNQCLNVMIEGYTCKKCKNNGVDQTWFSKIRNKAKVWNKAKDAAIDHLIKSHGILHKTMEKDMCLDMTPVINLLGGSRQPDEDESSEQWLELRIGYEKLSSVNRKRNQVINNIKEKAEKVAHSDTVVSGVMPGSGDEALVKQEPIETIEQSTSEIMNSKNVACHQEDFVKWESQEIEDVKLKAEELEQIAFDD